MIHRMTRFLLTTSAILGLTQAFSADICPFFLKREDGSILEGYYTPPDEAGSPICFAIQGSSCKSVLPWHLRLSDRANALGMGLIVLEKQGISQKGIDLPTYYETNSLQRRQEDYMLCLENMDLICPGWEGKSIFWGESEGGMIAANLGSQAADSTAAVLLFGAGGGMKPREEVKWALVHRLEKQGAAQEEVEEYMTFLDEQMDRMLLDPAADQQFLGNTFKWWASFLNAEEGATPLDGRSLPICLVHGIEDAQIPVHSADLAAEMLSTTNPLTYLRLEGYGHDLDTLEVQDAVCRWLRTVLSGEESSLNNTGTAQSITPPTLSEDAETVTFDVFSRGKDSGDKGGEISAGAKGSVDSDGNSRISGDVRGSYDFGNGLSGSVGTGGSINTDRDGNTSKEAHVEVQGSFKF